MTIHYGFGPGEIPPLDDGADEVAGKLAAALRTVTNECEAGRQGRPGYDITLDHLWEEASTALEAYDAYAQRVYGEQD